MTDGDNDNQDLQYNDIFTILQRIVPREPPDPQDFGAPAIKDGKSVEFQRANFHEDIAPVEKRLCFVDGGNNIILNSPSRTIHLVRLYASTFNGRSRLLGRDRKYTYIVEATYDAYNEEYVARIYDIDHSHLYENEEMYIESKILRENSITEVGGYVRRIGEWLMIGSLAKDKACDYIVRDGSLQTGIKGEGNYQNAALNEIMNNHLGLVGLSKTSTLRTTTGHPLISAVDFLAEHYGIRAPWYYYPLAENIHSIKGDMYVVKFHPHSDYAFRAEIYPEERAGEAIGAILAHGDDAEMPGYPYGLLDADIKARIRDEEVKMYRAMVYNIADEYTLREMHSVDAHDIISQVR